MAKKTKITSILKSQGIQVDMVENQYLWIGRADDADDRTMVSQPLVVSTPAQLKRIIKAAQTILSVIQKEENL